jgi:FkbM family methyltransferase
MGAIAAELPQIIRTRALVPADKRMGEQSFTLQGVTITLQNRFSQAREMYCRQVYFPDGFALRRGTTVIDLGANIGLFSLLAAKIGCRVIAVEAQRNFCDDIAALAQEQGVTIEIENILVGAKTGLLTYSHVTDSLDLSSEVVGMNELLVRHGIERLDFLKCDIEGSEFDLLSENTEWVDRVNHVAMEVHGAYGDYRAIVDLLVSRGFSVDIRDSELRHARTIHDGYLFARRDSP